MVAVAVAVAVSFLFRSHLTLSRASYLVSRLACKLDPSLTLFLSAQNILKKDQSRREWCLVLVGVSAAALAAIATNQPLPLCWQRRHLGFKLWSIRLINMIIGVGVVVVDVVVSSHIDLFVGYCPGFYPLRSLIWPIE